MLRMMLHIPRRILKDERSTEDSSESDVELDVREPEEEEDDLISTGQEETPGSLFTGN